MAKSNNNLNNWTILVGFVTVSFCLIIQVSALKCHECLWLTGLALLPGMPNCSNLAPAEALQDCSGGHIRNFFPTLTVKTEPPVCIKAKYVDSSGANGIMRYCGYPLAKDKDDSCIVSEEASSSPDAASQTTFDKKHPVTFFYCNERNGCNIGSVEDDENDGSCESESSSTSSGMKGSSPFITFWSFSILTVLSCSLTAAHFANLLPKV